MDQAGWRNISSRLLSGLTRSEQVVTIGASPCVKACGATRFAFVPLDIIDDELRFRLECARCRRRRFIVRVTSSGSIDAWKPNMHRLPFEGIKVIARLLGDLVSDDAWQVMLKGQFYGSVGEPPRPEAKSDGPDAFNRLQLADPTAPIETDGFNRLLLDNSAAPAKPKE
ncbi:MAG: hypothetical protein ACHREM_13410 [Polyangiales bacterium]